MSADKYPSIFSRQMEAIVYILSKFLPVEVNNLTFELHLPVDFHSILCPSRRLI